jgi:hypothetical protein
MYDNPQSGLPCRMIIGRSCMTDGNGAVVESWMTKEKQMSVGTILLIVLVLVLLGVLPTWGHSKNWGYGPSGGLGLVLLIVVILVVMGKI